MGTQLSHEELPLLISCYQITSNRLGSRHFRHMFKKAVLHTLQALVEPANSKGTPTGKPLSLCLREIKKAAVTNAHRPALL